MDFRRCYFELVTNPIEPLRSQLRDWDAADRKAGKPQHPNRYTICLTLQTMGLAHKPPWLARRPMGLRARVLSLRSQGFVGRVRS